MRACVCVYIIMCVRMCIYVCRPIHSVYVTYI